MAVNWYLVIAIGICGGGTVGRLFSHSANAKIPTDSSDRSFLLSSETVVQTTDARNSPGDGSVSTVPVFTTTPRILSSSATKNVPPTSSGGPSSQSSSAGDPFLLPHPAANAVTTSTPASNNNLASTSVARTPCSGNSGKVCNPTGGPGLTRQPNIVVFLCDGEKTKQYLVL